MENQELFAALDTVCAPVQWHVCCRGEAGGPWWRNRGHLCKENGLAESIREAVQFDASDCPVLRDEAARLTVACRRDRRVRGVDADTAGRARELAVRHGRRPVAGTRRYVRYAHTRGVLVAVLADERARGHVVRRIREERFLSRDE